MQVHVSEPTGSSRVKTGMPRAHSGMTPVEPATMPAVLELCDVSKTYRGARANGEPVYVVRGVNLTLRRAEVLCLMGTSGSGISTLLRHVNRLVEPDSGRILIDGVDNGALSARELRVLRARSIGMVFQPQGAANRAERSRSHLAAARSGCEGQRRYVRGRLRVGGGLCAARPA